MIAPACKLKRTVWEIQSQKLSSFSTYKEFNSISSPLKNTHSKTQLALASVSQWEKQDSWLGSLWNSDMTKEGEGAAAPGAALLFAAGCLFGFAVATWIFRRAIHPSRH